MENSGDIVRVKEESSDSWSDEDDDKNFNSRVKEESSDSLSDEEDDKNFLAEDSCKAESFTFYESSANHIGLCSYRKD
uniref:Uncharacterized protein n=1 Tax=Trichogramma kaykai TaxID=54128 RepID=A0ABD2XM35_9HYME